MESQIKHRKIESMINLSPNQVQVTNRLRSPNGYRHRIYTFDQTGGCIVESPDGKVLGGGEADLGAMEIYGYMQRGATMTDQSMGHFREISSEWAEKALLLQAVGGVISL